VGHTYAYIDKNGNYRWTEARRVGNRIVGHDGIAVEIGAGVDRDEIEMRRGTGRSATNWFSFTIPADPTSEGLYHPANWAAFLGAAFRIYRQEVNDDAEATAKARKSDEEEAAALAAAHEARIASLAADLRESTVPYTGAPSADEYYTHMARIAVAHLDAGVGR
jgi:hypothetical protein